VNNKLEDQSNDRSYFVITPQLVWALCQDPYEYTLWGVIKMIAGEQGECMLSTPDLAAAAMMSTGKLSSCRLRLLSLGLLTGELRRDPGYPQSVWHLTIPDLWAANVEWREAHPALLERIEGKRRQRKSLHPVKATAEPSPGERGITPGERGITPGETKKNHKEEPSVEPIGATAPEPPQPKPKRTRKAKPKPTRPPAVDVFHAQTNRWPRKPLYSDIGDAVGEAETDLAFWGDVVHAWIGVGWSPMNVSGMLDCFKRREIPTTKRNNGNGSGLTPAQRIAKMVDEGVFDDG